MTEVRLIESRVRNGVWTARLEGSGPTPPSLELVSGERVLATAEPTADGNGWSARAALPADILNDGVQVIAVREANAGTMIGQIVVQLGEELPDNLRAELALLRAELDMLKAAFRRHCLEKN